MSVDPKHRVDNLFDYERIVMKLCLDNKLVSLSEKKRIAIKVHGVQRKNVI